MELSYKGLGDWMRGKVQLLVVHLAVGEIKALLKAHKKQLEEYKYQRTFWNHRIIRKREIIKSYEGYLKSLRKEL